MILFFLRILFVFTPVNYLNLGAICLSVTQTVEQLLINSLWTRRVNTISIQCCFSHPSKDALYGFFYGSALTKYLGNKLGISVRIQT